eukprot:5139139-Pleurochrysis_carterae.AAC.2
MQPAIMWRVIGRRQTRQSGREEASMERRVAFNAAESMPEAVRTEYGFPTLPCASRIAVASSSLAHRSSATPSSVSIWVGPSLSPRSPSARLPSARCASTAVERSPRSISDAPHSSTSTFESASRSPRTIFKHSCRDAADCARCCSAAADGCACSRFRQTRSPSSTSRGALSCAAWRSSARSCAGSTPTAASAWPSRACAARRSASSRCKSVCEERADGARHLARVTRQARVSMRGYEQQLVCGVCQTVLLPFGEHAKHGRCIRKV